MLVEDNSGDTRGILERLLDIKEYDWDIETVDTPERALNICKQKDFDLVVTDLHFKDHNGEIKDGEELLIKLKKLDRNFKIIVYSMLNQPGILDFIINSLKINAYIIKGRKSLEELAMCLGLVFMGNEYISKEALDILRKNKDAMLMDRMNRSILRHLYRGKKVNELPNLLKKDGFSSCSQASVEIRIKEMRDYFDVTSTIQLVAIAKERKVFIA
ncbi:MAG: response regulator [Flavobacteriaceae bacterium]